MPSAGEIYLQKITESLTSLLSVMGKQNVQAVDMSTRLPINIGINGQVVVDESKPSKDKVVSTLTIDLNYAITYEEVING